MPNSAPQRKKTTNAIVATIEADEEMRFYDPHPPEEVVEEQINNGGYEDGDKTARINVLCSIPLAETDEEDNDEKTKKLGTIIEVETMDEVEGTIVDSIHGHIIHI